jgi:uncharacterized protein YwqG
MSDLISKTFETIDKHLRFTSIAKVDELKKTNNPFSSWFGGYAVGLHSEEIPKYKNEPMFPLLQVNCSELPYIHPKLNGIILFVVYINSKEIPFDKPHGEGWLIREYTSLKNLEPIKDIKKPDFLKTFPISWKLSNTEGPDWETAWDLTDLTAINESDDASDEFFERYSNYSGTKIGGYPSEIQHKLSIKGEFVFQIGSEKKSNWMWVDNGIGYFLKTKKGEWVFDCQFY